MPESIEQFVQSERRPGLDPDRLTSFLVQFDDDELDVIYKLIQSFRYVSKDEIKILCRSVYQKPEIQGTPSPCFIGLGSASESGAAIAYQFRIANQPYGCQVSDFIYYKKEIPAQDFTNFESVVFLDDLVGSGTQAAKMITDILEKLTPDFPIFYCPLLATTEGINFLEQTLENRVTVLPAEVLPDTSIFSPGTIFISNKEAQRARQICYKYGMLLEPDFPLGYKESAMLFAFEHNTPNNTLPIFWSSANGWTPLWPRSDKRKSDKELKFPKEITTSMSRHLFIGDLKIDNIANIQHFDPPLIHKDIETKIVEQRKLPPPILNYYNSPEALNEIARQKDSGRAITQDNGYSLSNVVIEKGYKVHKNFNLRNMERSRFPRLTFEPADYHHQILISERLDEHGLISVDGEFMSIRNYCEKYHSINFDRFEWSDVAKIPLIQRFATTTGVVVPIDKTRPNKSLCLVIGIRAGNVAVRNRQVADNILQASMSCTEGMLDPVDTGAPKQNQILPPNPFFTVKRALEKELGLIEGTAYAKDDIKMLALGYDAFRCQPVGVFSLFMQNFDFEDVYKCWLNAPDRNENRAIAYVPLEDNHFAEFLLGNLRLDGERVQLFSNHQLLGAAIVGGLALDDPGFHRLRFSERQSE